MKYLIAADIHGSAFYCEQLLERFQEEGADKLILLGDILYHGPRNELPFGYEPKKVIDMLNAISDKVFCIRGNCDCDVDQMVLRFPIMADYAMIPYGEKTIFLTHSEAAENINEAVEDTAELETEMTTEEKLQKELDEANEKVATLEDKYLRQVAEFDNYRKRTLKEKAEIIKNGGERVIESILPVLDDFERAIANMSKIEGAAEFTTGVELIYNKFAGILKQNGLQKIETEGADFNTDFHEAIAIVPTPDESMKGKVLDCVQAGYTLNDKVIRHAKVAVGE